MRFERYISAHLIPGRFSQYPHAEKTLQTGAKFAS